MNWNKAKSILLVCFLIIDVVLLTMYMKKTKDDGSLSISKNDAIEILKAQDIDIDEKELKTGGEYKSYILKYYDFDLEKINMNFFNGEGEIDDRYDLKLLTKDDKSVSLSQGTLFSYVDASEEVKYPDIDMDKAIELANEFLKEKEIFKVMQETVFMRNDLFASAMNPAEPRNTSLVRKHYAALRTEIDDAFGKLFEKQSKISDQK